MSGDRWVIVTLTALAAAFLLRVAMQGVQALTDVGFLPAFDSWQSGALPYPIVLASQFVILGLQTVVLTLVGRGQFRLSRRTAIVLGATGVAYLSFMAFRLVAGLTLLRGHDWFDAPLPAVFHIVLATFVLVTAWSGRAPQPT